MYCISSVGLFKDPSKRYVQYCRKLVLVYRKPVQGDETEGRHSIVLVLGTWVSVVSVDPSTVGGRHP